MIIATRKQESTPNKKTKYKPSKYGVVFHVVDLYNKNKNFIARKIYQTQETFDKIYAYANNNELTLLYRGKYYISKKELKIYEKDRYIEINNNNKILDTILIDIDTDDEETNILTRKAIKYLNKLGIYPSLYKTKKGYHMYIYIKEKEATTRNDARNNIIETGIKYFINHKIKLKTDIVSFYQPAWIEEKYNYIKEYKTKKIVNGRKSGFFHLYNIAKRYYDLYKPKASKKNIKINLTFNHKKELRDFSNTNASNPILYLQSNYYNCFALIRSNKTFEECYQIFKCNYAHELKENTFQEFYNYCLSVINQKGSVVIKNTKVKKENKYMKFYQRIEGIRQALIENGTSISINRLSKITNIPKSSMIYIINKIQSLDVILHYPKLCKAILIKKTYNIRSETYWQKKLKQVIAKLEKTKGKIKAKTEQKTKQETNKKQQSGIIRYYENGFYYIIGKYKDQEIKFRVYVPPEGG
jgi:hypothetical protein